MKRPLLLMVALFSSLAYASVSQPVTYSLNNNDTVQVTLSSVDLNRLTVKDDAIASVHCPAGFCVIDKQNDSSGGVLLSIKAAATPTQSGALVYPPFTLFIDTDNERHFGVLVIPLAEPAQTAIFTIKENQMAALIKEQKSTPYLNQLTTLAKQSLLAAEQHRDLVGFERVVMQADTTKCKEDRYKKHSRVFTQACIKQQNDVFLHGETQGVNALPRTIYHNGFHNVVIYELVNNTTHSERIVPERFYVEGLQALVIEPDISVLAPKQHVTMLQIVDGTGTAGMDHE